MAKKKDEAKIKFTAETGEFNEQIKSSESSLKEFRSELKLNASQMKETGDNTKTLKERQEILAKELEASKEKTEALSAKLEKAKEIFGDNSEEAKKLQTQLNNAKRAEQEIENDIESTNKQLKEQKTAFDNVADGAEKAGEKLTNAGKKMSVVSGGIVAVGAASIAAFNAVDEGADNAIRATGATGEAAEALEESYTNVAGSIVGDFGDIGSALGEVNTRFGFTGGELETATQKFLEFSNVTGMDATTAVQKVSRYMGDAGIKSSEYESVLDNLTVAAQTSGISMDTLAENLTKYGAPMRALGFETEESIAIFSSWEKAGVNTEIAFSGMKKAIGTWSKEGKDSRVEFKKTLDEIANCPDIASATTKAIEVFGQKAGPDLADAIQGGRFEYEDMLKVIEGSEGALSNTFNQTVDGGYELELAMQNAKIALSEVGDTLSSTLAPIVEGATEKLKNFANWWSGLSDKTQKTIITIAGVVAAIGPVLIIMGTVASSISKIANAMKVLKSGITIVKSAMSGLNLTFLASPITWIIVGIVALVATFAILWNKCEGFRNFWKNLWSGIKNVCSATWQAIKGFFTSAWNIIKNIWNSAGNFFSGIWNGIKNVFSNVGSWFREKFNSAKQGVQNAWSSVTGFFSNIYSKIKNKFVQVKDAIVQPFKTAIDKVKGFFNNLKLKFPKIKMPHFKITGKFSLNPPSVPKLGIEWYDKGAILTKPTVFGMNGFNAMVGGEKKPEAIVRIDKLQGYIGEEIEKHNQNAGLIALAQSIAELANRPIGLNVNGRLLAEATAGDTDNVNGMRTRLLDRGLILT